MWLQAWVKDNQPLIGYSLGIDDILNWKAMMPTTWPAR
jgi:hypothetical protein